MDVVFNNGNLRFNYRVAGVWKMNDYVLVHKSEVDEHWALPGGRVKFMEDSKLALKREFLEELNAKVEIGNMLWTTENFFEYEGQSFHEIGFYYQVNGEVEIFTTEPFYGIEEDQKLLYQWVRMDELHKLPLQPSFLREGIQQSPTYPVHLIEKDERKTE